MQLSSLAPLSSVHHAFEQPVHARPTLQLSRNTLHPVDHGLVVHPRALPSTVILSLSIPPPLSSHYTSTMAPAPVQHTLADQKQALVASYAVQGACPLSSSSSSSSPPRTGSPPASPARRPASPRRFRPPLPPPPLPPPLLPLAPHARVLGPLARRRAPRERRLRLLPDPGQERPRRRQVGHRAPRELGHQAQGGLWRRRRRDWSGASSSLSLSSSGCWCSLGLARPVSFARA